MSTQIQELRSTLTEALRLVDGLEQPVIKRRVLTEEMPEIGANFDVKEDMFDDEIVSRIAYGDVSGFRLHMGPSHLSHADPMFVPGGMSSHIHTWVGNTELNKDTTYESLRLNGVSTGEGRRINRSAYGLSTLTAEDEFGRFWYLVPNDIIMYYKQYGLIHRFWKDNPEAIRSKLPRGLQMMGGIKHYSKDEWSRPQVSPVQVGDGGFEGWGLDEALEDWQTGETLRISIAFPDRWDGKHSIVPDNVEHMRYGKYDSNTGLPIVEDSHKHVIPTVTQVALYQKPPSINIKRLWQSSDLFNAEDELLPPGASTHGYFMEAWLDSAREMISDITFENNYTYSNGIYGPRPGSTTGPRLRWRDASTHMSTEPILHGSVL